MTIITLLFIIIAAVVVIFLLVVATRPSQFTIMRSTFMEASPDRIFPQVNNLHNWLPWSPWAKLDPNAKNTYEGPTEGVDSSFHWDGNNQVGAGRMTITQSQPDQLVRIRLDFERPFKASHTAEFTFQPQGRRTLVTWTMSGRNSFVGKAMVLLMNCDKMIGTQFEKGLADLRTIAEEDARAKVLS